MEKDHGQLQKLGGVDEVASCPDTNLDGDIHGGAEDIVCGQDLTRPHVSITVRPENGGFRISKATLTNLAVEKDIVKLQNLGGVYDIVSCLETNLDGGIDGSAEDIARRQEAFGSNTYKKQPDKRFSFYVAEALKDYTVITLLGCAAISLGLGIKDQGLKDGWYSSGIIFIAVFLQVAFSAISNYWQNTELENFSGVSNKIQIDVIRSGQRQQISTFNITVGDVVCPKPGDHVPADGLFLDGHPLQVNKSSMAGDSNNVEVNLRQNPFLVSSSKVIDGYAQMLVTSVGMNTAYDQMKNSIGQDRNEDTPLQTAVRKLALSIYQVSNLVLVVLLVVTHFTINTVDKDGKIESNGSKTKGDGAAIAVKGFVAATAIIISAALPENLLLVVKQTLTFARKRMMADKVMVRKLSACEAIRCITTVCTNKTGTLTLNQMKVTKFWLGQEPMDEAGFSSSDPPYVVLLIQQGVALNTREGAYKCSRGLGSEIFGCTTEKAILSWAEKKLKMVMEELKQNCSILFVETFNSEKKRSGVLIKRKDDNTDTLHVHWKGAAEMILAMCSSYYDASGITKDLNEEEKMNFKQIIEEMAASGLRCVAFAHKQVSQEEGEDLKEKKKLKEENLTLLGLAGIEDPCRPEVKQAVVQCQRAGIKIKMITGDNVYTARAIAIECGILRSVEDSEGAVVEGEVFRNYTHEQRMEKVDNICVMARSSSFDNFLMVKCLELRGEVVAVNGIKDSDQAFKEAHFGFSSGTQGTEVAKESSDIVILDDNFVTVVKALLWGRCVYTNIQKSIQFLLTITIAPLVINLVATVSNRAVPLTAAQLCWTNLITGILGSLALDTEQPTSELMEKAPVRQMERLITNIMWRNLITQSLYQIGVLLMLHFSGESIFGVTEAVKNTLIFNTFVLCQVFNVFNARKLEKRNVLKDVHKNWKFLGIVGIMILLQVVMVEFLMQFANTKKLNWVRWGACVAIAAISWPVSWIAKCIRVPEL
ncbi:hypothetical protein SLE2022_169520 [Rubroshorea leprosula]